MHTPHANLPDGRERQEGSRATCVSIYTSTSRATCVSIYTGSVTDHTQLPPTWTQYDKDLVF